MPRLSKNPLTLDVWEEVINNFYVLISLLSDKREIGEFLDGFLTPTEKVMLAKRLAVALLINYKYQYEEICATLKVSSATVFSVQLAYYKSLAFQKAVEKISKKLETENEIEGVFKNLAILMPPVGFSDQKGRERFLNPLHGQKQKSFDRERKARTKVWSTAHTSIL